MTTEVRHNPHRHRYEIHVDGTLVGFASYRPHPDELVFVHTEINPEYEGRGLGSTLAKETLDDVRARGLGVVPLCPFIAGYIRQHAEYADLVGGERAKHS
ncbi:MAG TPA: GNAT family N-acetyltransferase [Micromonosporaceae bacterium]